jgi:hypothetical protein
MTTTRSDRWFVVRMGFGGRLDVMSETVSDFPMPDLGCGCVERFGECSLADDGKVWASKQGPYDAVRSRADLGETLEGREALRRWAAGDDREFHRELAEEYASSMLQTLADEYTERDRDGVLQILSADHPTPLDTIRAVHLLQIKHEPDRS